MTGFDWGGLDIGASMLIRKAEDEIRAQGAIKDSTWYALVQNQIMPPPVSPPPRQD